MVGRLFQGENNHVRTSTYLFHHKGIIFLPSVVRGSNHSIVHEIWKYLKLSAIWRWSISGIMAYFVSESLHLQAFLQCLVSGETAYTIVDNALKSYETCFSEICILFYRNLKLLNECSTTESETIYLLCHLFIVAGDFQISH